MMSHVPVDQTDGTRITPPPPPPAPVFISLSLPLRRRRVSRQPSPPLSARLGPRGERAPPPSPSPPPRGAPPSPPSLIRPMQLRFCVTGGTAQRTHSGASRVNNRHLEAASAESSRKVQKIKVLDGAMIHRRNDETAAKRFPHKVLFSF